MNAIHEDKILYQARLHWIIYTWPIILGVVGVYVFLMYDSLSLLAYLLLGVAAVLGLSNYINYQFSYLNITPKCLVINTGVIVRVRTNIPWQRIESIDVTQSIIGSILGYGSILFIGTGSTRNYIKNIASPQLCRQYIEQVMEK